MALQLRFCLGIVVFTILRCASFCLAQAPQSSPEQPPEHPLANTSIQADQPFSGCISGSVIDQSGAVVAGASVKVSRDGKLLDQQAVTGANGQFFIANVSPGSFQLTITSSGFAPQTLSGVLHSEEIDTVPPIVLGVASSTTEVQVRLTQEEVAQEQLKVQEKQRVLGIVPNFYVSYVPNAAPLNTRQKFQLAERSVIDPFTLLVVAGTAGVEQAQNHFFEYGQGLQGYGKRFGANFGDTLTGTFIGGAILPSLLKQDPRFFYKADGSARSRFVYAIGMAVICKGDNGHWQFNFSNVLGFLAAGGISNLYYPSEDRSGADLTFENAAIGLAGNAVENVIQEFIVPRLGSLIPHHHQAQQQ